MITVLDAERKHALRHAVALIAEGGVAEASIVLDVDERIAIAEAISLPVKQIADCAFQQFAGH
jgi:hypothetical protein